MEKLLDNTLASDLDHILDHTEALWEALRGQRLFITGGTGFFGTWLVESFVRANDRFGLEAEAWILTRDPHAFKKRFPRLGAHPALRFHAGDVRSFVFLDLPDEGFSHVIHGATPASAALSESDPLLMLDTIITGTRQVLQFAKQAGTKRFLLTSSGAIYGKQPADVSQLAEEYSSAPDPMNPGSAYAEGKRVAEQLCALYSAQGPLQATVARCFAFIGPHLPTDIHYAAGNFIRDAIRGGPVRVNGDGTPSRSYLYAADLMIWLWTILFNGHAGRAYNVGSESPVTIGELARLIATQAGCEVEIGKKPVPGKAAERYVPSTHRATTELGLVETVTLPDAIERTLRWHGRKSS